MRATPQRMKVALLVGAVIALALVVRSADVPRQLVGLVEWVRETGAVGGLTFGGVYVASAVLLLPASALTLGAGFLWGPVLGLVIVLPAALLAATVAFLLGRTVARGWVQKRVAAHHRLRAIDEAVGSGGFRVVLLLRLSPLLPFNLLNYTLGLTRVSLRDYVLGSAVGMIPGAFLYLYLGSLVTSASQLLSGEPPPAGLLGTALAVVGLVATAAVTVLITRAAKKSLARALAESTDAGP